VPSPSQPSLTLTRLSSTAFLATFSGDAGVTNRLFYRRLLGSLPSDVTGPTRIGDGNVTVLNLSPEGHYLVWGVSDNGELSLPRLKSISLVTTTNTILSAIKTRWYESVPLTELVVGGLYVNEVPETINGSPPELPYAYVESGQTTFDWTHTETYMELAEVEFCVLCAGAAKAEAAALQLRSVFDWKDLPFTDDTSSTVYFRPSRYEIAAEPIRYKDGSLIYRTHVGYSCWIDRQYPLS